MHLILTSCDFSNENSRKTIFENLKVPVDKCRILFIPNERARRNAILSDKFYLHLMQYGFLRENIYVLDYYDAEKFANLDIDAIFVGGGNTFGTFYRIKKHGFLEPLKKYIESGVTYIGGSAGVHIVSRSTKHVLPYDPDRNNTEDYTALGYFDGIVICHFSKEREAHYEALKAEGEFKVYTLTNDQAIVIDE